MNSLKSILKPETPSPAAVRFLAFVLLLLLLPSGVMAQKKTASQYLADYQQYLKEGKMEQAAATMRVAVKLYPDNRNCQYELGVVS